MHMFFQLFLKTFKLGQLISVVTQEFWRVYDGVIFAKSLAINGVNIRNEPRPVSSGLAIKGLSGFANHHPTDI